MTKDKFLTPEVAELARLKKEYSWSYDRLAHELGVHSQTVIAWLIGKSKPSPLALRVVNRFLEDNR